jgi:hypothetical protein
MKTWGSGGMAPPFLTLVLDGGEWSASRSCHFKPGERRVGEPQSRSGCRGVEKNLVPAGNQNPAFRPVARHYTD